MVHLQYSVSTSTNLGLSRSTVGSASSQGATEYHLEVPSFDCWRTSRFTEQIADREALACHRAPARRLAWSATKKPLPNLAAQRLAR
jgi:hypothetical protein